MGRHLGQHRGVILGIGDHGHPFVVLRRRADHRRAADVDVLDGLGKTGAARDRLLEGIEIDHQQVDAADTVLPPSPPHARDCRECRASPP